MYHAVQEMELSHQYLFAGQVAPTEECHQLAEKYGFKVVEDASHSPLAWDNNTCGKVEVVNANGLTMRP